MAARRQLLGSSLSMALVIGLTSSCIIVPVSTDDGDADSGGLSAGPMCGSAGCSPAGWTCFTYAYGDGVTCDCGCGAPDPDCADATLAACGGQCEALGTCTRSATCAGIDPVDNSRCLALPDTWSCDPPDFGDGEVCDCGCGALDSDCADSTVASCERCYVFGNCISTTTGSCVAISPLDNSICTIPSAWTCERSYYGDGAVCDCGCGVVDSDCPDANVASCARCTNNGGCNYVSCTYINATNNAVCL